MQKYAHAARKTSVAKHFTQYQMLIFSSTEFIDNSPFIGLIYSNSPYLCIFVFPPFKENGQIQTGHADSSKPKKMGLHGLCPGTTGILEESIEP